MMSSLYIYMQYTHAYVYICVWNDHRCNTHALELTVSAEEIVFVNLPLKCLDANGRTMVAMEPWPILDVHSTLSFLFKDAKVQIPRSKLVEYWEKSKQYGEKWAQSIPDNEMHVTIPIGIYGDSAKVETAFFTEHILAYFLNLVLWRPKSVRWSRFLICAIPESRMTAETNNSIMRRITWSANHAFFGCFPTTGHLGQPLDGHAAKAAGLPLTDEQFRFQVTELRGDWSFHKKIWAWPKVMWNAADVCHLCTAKGISNNFDEVFWNLEDNNHHEFTLTEYLAHRMPSRRVRALGQT